ncbi:MAG: TSUP family transporter, partial [Proteobacteria bacterium]|nr:TSUP family transporter [Pseudomonadota bacterium]
MSYLVICTVAFLVSGLTLFSGFGLGTLLMPAFALFFAVELAVAATAIVHLANNIFKLGLVGRRAHLGVVFRFALPAAVFAMAGALLLNYFTTVQPIAQYALGGRTFAITPVKAVIAALIASFAFVELTPFFEKLAFNPKFIPLGGALSGFFGGLSGHQGALRTAFLIRAGLQKEAFIGTVVLSAVVVDISRLMVYGTTFFSRDFEILRDNGGIELVIAGTLAAFFGAFIGSRLITKVTMRAIQSTVGVMLLMLAIALG